MRYSIDTTHIILMNNDVIAYYNKNTGDFSKSFTWPFPNRYSYSKSHEVILDNRVLSLDEKYVSYAALLSYNSVNLWTNTPMISFKIGSVDSNLNIEPQIFPESVTGSGSVIGFSDSFGSFIYQWYSYRRSQNYGGGTSSGSYYSTSIKNPQIERFQGNSIRFDFENQYYIYKNGEGSLILNDYDQSNEILMGQNPFMFYISNDSNEIFYFVESEFSSDSNKLFNIVEYNYITENEYIRQTNKELKGLLKISRDTVVGILEDSFIFYNSNNFNELFEFKTKNIGSVFYDTLNFNFYINTSKNIYRINYKDILNNRTEIQKKELEIRNNVIYFIENKNDIYIYDYLGRNVLSVKNLNRNYFDFKILENGIYFYKVIGLNKIYTGKFLIN